MFATNVTWPLEREVHIQAETSCDTGNKWQRLLDLFSVSHSLRWRYSDDGNPHSKHIFQWYSFRWNNALSRREGSPNFYRSTTPNCRFSSHGNLLCSQMPEGTRGDSTPKNGITWVQPRDHGRNLPQVPFIFGWNWERHFNDTLVAYSRQYGILLALWKSS